MDPFTQRMLEKAEQRSRALGISKFPIQESRDEHADANSAGAMASQQPQEQQQDAVIIMGQQQQLPAHSSATTTTKMRCANSGSGNSKNSSQLQVVEKTLGDAGKTTASANKVMRHFSAVDKENMEMGIEINIMTDKNIEVQVQVEEQDVTDDEAQSNQRQGHQIDASDPPAANIRDTSRNRLQRLGALYSNPNDLSSPIHRTEGNFHAGLAEDEGLDTNPKRPKQRYGKLVALANTINLWEDDTVHHQQQANPVPPPKPDLPSRRLAGETSKKKQAPQPPIALASPLKANKAKNEMPAEQIGDSVSNKTKQLKWDPKVINSLEAQGFQRRESSTVKLAYDYDKDCDEKEQQPEQSSQPSHAVKLANTFTVASTSAAQKATTAPAAINKNIHTVKPGLVSGRAAAFENKAASVSHQPQRPQKDPTELSLRERMQLFERNKGEALIPKAALGMAPSITQIRQDNALHAKKDELKACSSAPTVASVKPNADTKVRNKVAALVASATTISENKIKADIQKQRQEDMQVLANRFNRQKDIFTKDQPQQQEGTALKQTQSHGQTKATNSSAPSKLMRPPPPPPPMPSAMANPLYSKRRSPSDAIDDESKRARTTSVSNAAVQHLYPTLSTFESNESCTEDDNVDCATTTATISGDELNERRGSAVASAALTTEETSDESYMESEDADEDDSSVGICDGSLGRVVMHVVQKNDQQQGQQTKIKEVRYANKNLYYGDDGNCVDSSMNSSEGSVGVDDYLDEAFDDGDDDCTQESGEDDIDTENGSVGSKMSKGTTTSNSFTFRKTPRKCSNYQTISEEQNDFEPSCSANNPNASAQQQQPVKSQLSINQEDESMVTLVHTVSIYRRQQNANSANCTPVRWTSREEQVPLSEYAKGRNAIENPDNAPIQQQQSARELFTSNDVDDDDDDDDADPNMESSSADNHEHMVQERIKVLLDEVCKQQQIIAQTSQALNLCAATIEFSGSTESVEGERHLLVATHRRQSCLDEVQRLRVEKCLRPKNSCTDRGRLIVKEITVPLRQDYIRKLATDTISGHHLVCLLKYNENVVATKTVPTLPGLLAVKFPDTLEISNVYTDFRVTLEIYGMTAQREVLPHDVKYHINLSKKCGIKTPKKKGSDNRLVMPPVQSPAGPNVVRTPALVQYGFAIFSLRESQRTTWSLTQVLGVSPLEGVLHMKINCEITVKLDYKGFLTMFEDISGFGAWHRRWCHLNGKVLKYWKYPDDEMKKPPMGTIDLRSCISRNATTAPRDICARMNTILLECQRPAKDTDQESLIIVPNGPVTIVRHLLSADTKEERDMWCIFLSKGLTLLRAWGSSFQ